MAGREGSEFRLPAGITSSTGTLCLHADNAVTATFNGTTVLVQSNPTDPDNPTRGRSVGGFMQDDISIPALCRAIGA